MSYTKPDVSVFIDLEAQSFDVPTPGLWPCMVGEHYHVIEDTYGGFSRANESQTYTYPDLPDSYNDSSQKLTVDTDGDFAPKVEMVLDATGERVEITDKVTFNGTDFTVPVITDTLDGVSYTGAIYVSYRALSDEYSGVNTDLIKAQTTEQLVSLFGSAGIGPANPLGFAMFKALEHAQIGVSGVAIGSTPAGDGSGTYQGMSYDTVQAYTYAFEFLKGENVYGIVPLTHNNYVLDTALSHVEYMSSPSGKSERHLVFSPSIDENWPVRSESDSVTDWYNITTSSGTVAEQTVLNDGTDPATEETDAGYSHEVDGYKILRISSGNGDNVGTYLIGGISKAELDSGSITLSGESFSLVADESLDADEDGSTDPSAVVYIDIGESLFSPSNQRIRLSDKLQMRGESNFGYVTELGVADINSLVKIAGDGTGDYDYIDNDEVGEKRVTFFRPKSGFEVVEGIRDMARSYSTGRLTFIGPDWYSALIDGKKTDVRGFYAAAQLAAELCLVGQQQAGAVPGSEGLTGLRNSVEEVWKSSRYFNSEQLDTAASGGFTWLVNDQKGLPVYTRHLLTTDMSSIEARETILNVERDFAARTFRKSLRPDIHRYRIDNSLLQTLTMKANSIAEALTSPDSQSRSFRSISIEEIAQDPDQPDTVNMKVDLTHLYPLNNIKVTLSIVL